MEDDDGEVRGTGKDTGGLVDRRVPGLVIFIHVADLARGAYPTARAFPLVSRGDRDLALLVAEHGTDVFVLVGAGHGGRHVVEPLVLGEILFVIYDELVDDEKE